MQNELDTASAAIESEISRIQTLKPYEVRALWRDTFKREVPKALTRDLLVRILCWHLQENAFGGHDRAILQILASYAKGRPDGRKVRRLKPGTEIVREYHGERHTVAVTDEGFRWREGYYSSLTAIAQAITGTNWNGPRFFGLRNGLEAPGDVPIPARSNSRGGTKRAPALSRGVAHG